MDIFKQTRQESHEWSLAAFYFSMILVVQLGMILPFVLDGCTPKPKPAAPPVTSPLRVDKTRQQLEQKVQAAKDTLQSDHQKSESAVTNYQNAAADYDASRVQLP